MPEMTAEIAAGLRAPFPTSAIGKLPRITCPKCRDSRSKNCDEHRKSKCRDCDNWITEKHIHLDYIGHAPTTDRLLQADPGWTWEPLAFGSDGLPMFDDHGGLWIRLTVAGVTRLGYGDAQGKRGADAVKEAIGDALRNGAMRFGVALDLWSKTPMDDHGDVSPPIGNGQTPAQRQAPARQAPANGTAKPAAKQTPGQYVDTLIEVSTAERAEAGVTAISKSGLGERDVTANLKTEQREALGVQDGDTVTLNDLALLVLDYVGKHKRAVNAVEAPA
ncbi:MAG: hypothetical protein M3N43_03025 [Actinomycetota bacterium]|nr:hypothetical protein [Actinomycetota bacterium]